MYGIKLMIVLCLCLTIVASGKKTIEQKILKKVKKLNGTMTNLAEDVTNLIEKADNNSGKFIKKKKKHFFFCLCCFYYYFPPVSNPTSTILTKTYCFFFLILVNLRQGSHILKYQSKEDLTKT